MNFYSNNDTANPDNYSIAEYPRHLWMSFDNAASFSLLSIDVVVGMAIKQDSTYCSRPGSHQIYFPYREFFSPTSRCDKGLNDKGYSIRTVRINILDNIEQLVTVKSSIGVSSTFRVMNYFDKVHVSSSYLMAISREEQKAYPIYDLQKDIAFEKNCILIGEFPKI